MEGLAQSLPVLIHVPKGADDLEDLETCPGHARAPAARAVGEDDARDAPHLDRLGEHLLRHAGEVTPAASGRRLDLGPYVLGKSQAHRLCLHHDFSPSTTAPDPFTTRLREPMQVGAPPS